ncbi:MAG: peptide deformylase [Planctomycetota bacterium]
MKIHVYPDPVLRERARAVAQRDIGPALEDLAREMIETMRSARGVGLAANQVGKTVRIAVVGSTEEGGSPRVLLNPTVKARKGLIFEEEGCLSIPGINAKIRRYENVLVEAMNLQGKKFQIEASGVLARALQHEIDHLAGVLLIDRLSPAARLTCKTVLADLEARAKS